MIQMKFCLKTFEICSLLYVSVLKWGMQLFCSTNCN